MKKLFLLLSLSLAFIAVNAHAQTIWTYEVITADNKATLTTKPTMDISYPAATAPMPVYDPRAPQGVVITAQEAAARRNAPTLIILLGTGVGVR